MKYDFVIFCSFMEARTLGAYRIASVLREEGYNCKTIDFFQYLLNDPKRQARILDQLKECVHDRTLFAFSLTFVKGIITLGYKIPNSNEPPIEMNDLVKHLGRQHQGKTAQGKALDIAARKILNDSRYQKAGVVTNSFRDFVKQLKTFFPTCKLLVGGVGATPDILYNDLTEIDYCYTGYGEVMAREKMANIIEGGTEPHVFRAVHDDPKYDFHNQGPSYHKSDLIFPEELLTMEISRGCRFRCKFCAFSLIGRKVTDKYIRHPERIYEELILNYENFGTTAYNIADDTFNETTEKLESLLEVFDRFRARTGASIQFNCYIRLELLHRFPEQIDLLKRLGIRGCTYGIESLNYESAKAIGKGIRTEDVIATVQKCKDAWGPDSVLQSGFIVGLPHDTPETVNRWMNMILNKEIALDSVNVNPLYLKTTEELNMDQVFSSVFDRESGKYGYEFDTMDLTDHGQNHSWHNDRNGFTYDSASLLATEWLMKIRKSRPQAIVASGWSVQNREAGIIEPEFGEISPIFLQQYFSKILRHHG